MYLSSLVPVLGSTLSAEHLSVITSAREGGGASEEGVQRASALEGCSGGRNREDDCPLNKLTETKKIVCLTHKQHCREYFFPLS